MTSAVFAHQGGWDEILFVAVPIAIFAGLLAVANRRASRMEKNRHTGRPDAGPDAGPETGKRPGARSGD